MIVNNNTDTTQNKNIALFIVLVVAVAVAVTVIIVVLLPWIQVDCIPLSTPICRALFVFLSLSFTPFHSLPLWLSVCHTAATTSYLFLCECFKWIGNNVFEIPDPLAELGTQGTKQKHCTRCSIIRSSTYPTSTTKKMHFTFFYTFSDNSLPGLWIRRYFNVSSSNPSKHIACTVSNALVLNSSVENWTKNMTSMYTIKKRCFPGDQSKYSLVYYHFSISSSQSSVDNINHYHSVVYGFVSLHFTSIPLLCLFTLFKNFFCFAKIRFVHLSYVRKQKWTYINWMAENGLRE